MKDLTSVVLIQQGDSGWEIADSRIRQPTNQAKESVKRRFPQQVGELTIDTSKRDEEGFPYLLKSHFPDHLKGSGNGVYTTLVYTFGRSVSPKEGEVLHIALQRNVDKTLKQVVGVPINCIEDYETRHEFYQI
jgi:hypothetical protein